MEKELKDKLYNHMNAQSKFHAQKEHDMIEKQTLKKKSFYIKTQTFNEKSEIQLPKKLKSLSPHQSYERDHSEGLFNFEKRRNGLTSNNLMIQNTKEKLKQIIAKTDFSFALLNKLKSFKEYENIKKSYLEFEESATEAKINANLFDNSLSNLNEKKIFDKKLKNLSNLHYKPQKKENFRNFFLLSPKQKNEKKSYTNTSNSNVMSDKSFSKNSARQEYFKKEEGKIENMRNKIYKIFEESYYNTLGVKDRSYSIENANLSIKNKKHRK